MREFATERKKSMVENLWDHSPQAQQTFEIVDLTDAPFQPPKANEVITIVYTSPCEYTVFRHERAVPWE
jgi:hypothetical protein